MSAPEQHDYEAMYAHNDVPWDIGRPQVALAKAFDDDLVTGTVLDAGCGTGEHALLAASKGFATTGIDLSPTAVSIARQKARSRNLSAEFHAADLTASPNPKLLNSFDTVLDCGTFHIFNNAQRVAYLSNISAYTNPGSRYLLLAFSDKGPGKIGPRRLSRQSIETGFSPDWKLLSIEDAIIETLIPNLTMPAWFAVLERVR